MGFEVPWVRVTLLSVTSCLSCLHTAGATAEIREDAQANKGLLIAVESSWHRVPRVVPNWPKPRLLWKGEPLVHPRGVMLDAGRHVLYVSDPGEPFKDPANFPARIVTFPVLPDNTLGIPKVFFSQPGFLFSAKWGIPATIEGRPEVLVADQGEAKNEYEFSGKNAKVFSIPVLPDGSAGKPRVLWSGLPFVCPTGIAVLGRYIYITDPCAGPIRERPDRPGWKFVSSAIFALSVKGGTRPKTLLEGAPFTSLIGICPLTPGEFIVNDTDSARLDPTDSGGRPGFAPPAGADRWILKILDSKMPRLSKPIRTHWTEEGPLTLKLGKLPDGMNQNLMKIEFRARGRNRIVPAPIGTNLEQFAARPPGPTRRVSIPIRSIRDPMRITINIASDVMEDSVNIGYTLSDGKMSTDGSIDLMKSKEDFIIPLDNKHGGAMFKGFGGGGSGFGGSGFGGGGASGTWLRFTTDNAPGHGAIYIYQDDGGPLVALAEGPPLERPISAQLTQDGTSLWLLDQANGSLFTLPFPCYPDCWNKIFPEQLTRWSEK
jgi:hypothetical protein